jgi:transposase-like protein
MASAAAQGGSPTREGDNRRRAEAERHLVDGRGQANDFPLSAKRDASAAKRFFREALGQLHTVNRRTITVGKNPAYPYAATDLRRAVSCCAPRGYAKPSS